MGYCAATTERRVALITGGAGGIGRATAALLAERGMAVAVADLDEAAAVDVATGIGDGAVGLACDVGDPDSVRACVDRVTQELGTVSLLHNNAAATSVARRADPEILELSLEAWDETMRVNLRGTLLMTQAVLPGMLAAGDGSIVNMSSIAGLAGGIAQTSYGVSKAAIIALTKTTATQYGKQGIRCNAIVPGLIETPENATGHAGGAMRDLMLRQHLTPRLGVPHDIAEAVWWLASEATTYVSGTVITVDGGFSAHSPTVADMLDLRGGAPAGR